MLMTRVRGQLSYAMIHLLSPPYLLCQPELQGAEDRDDDRKNDAQRAAVAEVIEFHGVVVV